ncbi:MAG: glycosyltransferase [Gammaproteobacteria bacterium]
MPGANGDDTPFCPDVGVVFLVPDHWRSLPQLRHQVAIRLARYFRVLWVDAIPTGTGRFIDDQQPAAERPDFSADGLIVRSPRLGHKLLHRVKPLRPMALRSRVRDAVRTLRLAGVSRVVLYVWRPGFADFVDEVEHDFLLYHVDDEYSFSESERPMSAGERKLLAAADCVFVHSPRLLELKGACNPNTVFLPNGVDYLPFSSPVPEHPELAAIPRPRLGYAGVVKSQLDLDLLLALARVRPDWSLVLVGPLGNTNDKAATLAALQALPNVYLLGRKPLADLPAYVQHFDVGIMPYAINAYTSCIYPLKLHEYLAAGIPVVSTPIRSALDFSGILGIAADVDGWCQAVEAALAGSAHDTGGREMRQQLARQHDWSHIVARIAVEIGKLLGGDVERDGVRLDEVARRPFDAADLAQYSRPPPG